MQKNDRFYQVALGRWKFQTPLPDSTTRRFRIYIIITVLRFHSIHRYFSNYQTVFDKNKSEKLAMYMYLYIIFPPNKCLDVIIIRLREQASHFNRGALPSL
jgi:hypothetical protein